jgi:hypothetical protein
LNENKNNNKNNLYVSNKKNIQYNHNFPSTNSSIDIKSSMFQSRRDNINTNYLANNILSEDNVNIHLPDTYSNQIINNTNSKFNNKYNNSNHVNKIITDTQKYTFGNNNSNTYYNGFNNEKQDNMGNNSQNIINNINEINVNNTNGYNTNYNYISMNIDNNIMKKKISNIANSSLIMQNNNNNYYSQNNIQRNSKSLNISNKNNRTESKINNKNMNEENNSKNRKYKRINRLRSKKKDNNYIKAVVSINIPGEEEQEDINLVKQFNLLVDRLNGQKTRSKAKENIKKSDKYYELYKITNENNLTSFLNPTNKKIKNNNNLFDKNNNIIENKDILNRNYNKKIGNTYFKITNYNLNRRIMALKERTFTSFNNSFRNDNRKENSYSKNNIEIVLPSNYIHK